MTQDQINEAVQARYKQFNVGDKVRDKYGKVWEVLFQQGCQVWVGCNTWIHPSNLRPVM